MMLSMQMNCSNQPTVPYTLLEFPRNPFKPHHVPGLRASRPPRLAALKVPERTT